MLWYLLSTLWSPSPGEPGSHCAAARPAVRLSIVELGLALSQDIVHMSGLYNILTDTEPPRARPGPPRPSSASGGPPAAARCGGVTNPTTEHRERDAVGRSEAQLGVCIAHPGLSRGPINRRLRRRAQELLLQPVHTSVRHSMRAYCVPKLLWGAWAQLRSTCWAAVRGRTK